MKVQIFIPYANGDCTNGFKYDKPISRQEYVAQQIKEWKDRRVGVHTMVTNPETEKLGYNIAINPYQKRHFDYTQQTYAFHQCEALLYDMEEKELTLQSLDEIYRKNAQNNESFMLYVYLNPKQMKQNSDLVTDFNQWAHESMKLWGLMNDPDYQDIFDEEEVLKHLPQKDFKIKIKEDNSTAVLKKCRFIDPMDEPYSFVLLVDQIKFVKE